MHSSSASSAWQPAVSSALPPSLASCSSGTARTTGRCRGSSPPRRSAVCRAAPRRSPPSWRGTATSSGTRSRRRPSRRSPRPPCFIASTSPHSMASGFSTMMCLPACAARDELRRVLIRIAGDVDDVDVDGSASIASRSVWTRDRAAVPRLSSAGVSGRDDQTAVTCRLRRGVDGVDVGRRRPAVSDDRDVVFVAHVEGHCGSEHGHGLKRRATVSLREHPQRAALAPRQ